MEPAYRYHRAGAQAAAVALPARAVVAEDAGAHASIDALDAVYPDARFVMTHRDVGKVLPSVCALYDTLSSILTERPDPRRHRRPEPRDLADRRSNG